MTGAPRYESALATRYASPAMLKLWSAEHRARIWRRLWLALAREQRQLGADIPQTAIDDMETHLDDPDLTAVRRYEHRVRHDVMAHIHHFADQAPAARPYLHLGATSAYVTDNADLIVMRDAMRLLLGRMAAVLRSLRSFAHRQREMPTVAYTHFQPAQLTTVGKRATLWLYDFCLDADSLCTTVDSLPFRGCKGTTGTQASYLQLFGGDDARVRELDRRVAEAFGFRITVPVCGQTYTRKIDSSVLGVLAGVAESASKFGTDLRLLQHEGEVLEPFEEDQVGSSAMPYKRNPVRAERVCGLARYALSLRDNTSYTVATQWLERSLDDSANRRLALPESFLAADAILMLCTNIAAGLVVREDVVRRNVERYMPFIATERWLLMGVARGGDRQALHEIIRRHSRAASEAVARGEPNDLLERLSADAAFSSVNTTELRSALAPSGYIGRAPHQVTEFLEETVDPLLARLDAHAVTDEATVTV